jgi:hypothetical protein
MYILTFKKSRSVYFEKGLALAKKLGGSWDGEEYYKGKKVMVPINIRHISEENCL